MHGRAESVLTALVAEKLFRQARRAEECGLWVSDPRGALAWPLAHQALSTFSSISSPHHLGS